VVSAAPAAVTPLPGPARARVEKPSEQADARFVDPATIPAADADAVAKAREALRAKMQQAEHQFTPVVTATRPASQPAQPYVSAPSTRPVVEPAPVPQVQSPKQPKMAKEFRPLEGPALPFSADKSQRLADLLQKYKADQITPAEYQAERAKILAGQ